MYSMQIQNENYRQCRTPKFISDWNIVQRGQALYKSMHSLTHSLTPGEGIFGELVRV